MQMSRQADETSVQVFQMSINSSRMHGEAVTAFCLTAAICHVAAAQSLRKFSYACQLLSVELYMSRNTRSANNVDIEIFRFSHFNSLFASD